MQKQFPLLTTKMLGINEQLCYEISEMATIYHRENSWQAAGTVEEASRVVTELAGATTGAEDKNRLANAMLIYPTGRAELAAAKVQVDEMRATIDAAKLILDLCRKNKTAELSNHNVESQECLDAFSEASEAVRLINEQLHVSNEKLMYLVTSSLVEFGKAYVDRLLAGLAVVCEPLIDGQVTLKSWFEQWPELSGCLNDGCNEFAAGSAQWSVAFDSCGSTGLQGLLFLHRAWGLLRGIAVAAMRDDGASKEELIDFRALFNQTVTDMDLPENRESVDPELMQSMRSWFTGFWETEAGKQLTHVALKQVKEDSAGKLEMLIRSFNQMFGEVWCEIQVCPMPTGDRKDQVLAWQLPDGYEHDVLVFAKSSKNGHLERQVTYLLCFYKAARAAFACSRRFESFTSWDDRQLDSTTAELVGA